jgi:hypothetical protein
MMRKFDAGGVGGNWALQHIPRWAASHSVRVHFDVTPLMTVPIGRSWHKSDAELDEWLQQTEGRPWMKTMGYYNLYIVDVPRGVAGAGESPPALVLGSHHMAWVRGAFSSLREVDLAPVVQQMMPAVVQYLGYGGVPPPVPVSHPTPSRVFYRRGLSCGMNLRCNGVVASSRTERRAVSAGIRLFQC